MAASSISAKLKFILIFLNVYFFSLIPLSLSNPNLLNDTIQIQGIHEILSDYKLPIGLLPGNVKGYSLKADNRFTVELTHHCYVTVGGHKVFYDSHIKGKLDYGKIHDVEGIQVKTLFLWVSVTSVEVDQKTNMIEFHAGVFTKKFSVRDFHTIPTCRRKELTDSSDHYASI